MLTRKLAWAGVLASVGAFWAPALWADELHGTRFHANETEHRVEVRVDRGHATLVVERTVQHRGSQSDQATWFLALPESSVATRLRTAGVGPRGERIWFEGDLMEAEAAAAKYQELTGIGGYYPKDPALLSWRSQGLLALQVFPVAPATPKTVEYTLEMPMTYEGGKYSLKLPLMGLEEQPASLHFTRAFSGDTLLVNGIPVSASGRVEATQELQVQLLPSGLPPVGGTFAKVALSNGQYLEHVTLQAAPQVAQIPGQAAIVVVLDNSRSMRDSFPLALSATRAYLSNFPKAEVDLVLFDRKVHQPFPGHLPVKTLLSRMASLTPEPANGSQLDDALARADGILAGSKSPARRIVVITDFRTREALTPARLAALPLQSGAVVHLATVESGNPELTRDDTSDWAPIARKTGGLFWNASCLEEEDRETQRVYEEWARPKRLDHVTLRGLPEEVFAGETLDEGRGIEHLAVSSEVPDAIEISGELWSRPVHVAVRPSNEQGRLWSALFFGSSLFDSVDEKDQMLLAKKGHAVSPVTSFLAVEPGVRPSIEGLEPDESGLGLTGTGEGGGGVGEGIGLGSIGTLGHGPDSRKEVLNGALRAAWNKCGGGTGEAVVSLENTGDEIVDVGKVSVSGPASTNPKLSGCLREELWNFELPTIFEHVSIQWEVRVKVG